MKVHTAKFVRSAFSADDLLTDRYPEIAFIGRSNVGKSSLLNRLIARKSLARISSTPGRTRSINYYLIKDSFYFVDLPGYGYAKVGKQERQRWGRLIEEYFQRVLPGAMIVQIVDAKVGATALDIQAEEYIRGCGGEPCVVATKIDKVSKSKRKRALDAIVNSLNLNNQQTPIPFSAVSGEGVALLWRRITAYLEAA